jgi:hypothetical protein
LVSAYLGSTGNANALMTGKTLQFTATGSYSDGSSATIATSAITWSSTNPAVFGISSSGLVTAVASGTAYVQAKIGTVNSSPWGVTVSGPPKLVSVYLGSKGNANTMIVGRTLQFTAYGTYSDGSVATLPDAQGNAVTAWNTTNHSVAKVSTLGHVTALGVGSANIEAQIGTLRASVWGVTVTAAPVPHTNLAGSAPAGPGAAIGDTFLGPFWTLVTPPGGSASISNGHLYLGVPGGSNHDPMLPSNQSVRVVQAIGNDNFDVAIKIDSQIAATDANTSQGLMVLSDDNDFTTFALETDGTKIGLSAHTVTGGVPTTVLADTDFSQYQNPTYLRLTKTGTAYVAYYSVDGADWTQATSFTYTNVPALIGPFASNFNRNPANTLPVVMSVNWFHVQ